MKIDWDAYPHANYAAMDGDGEVWLFENEPEVDSGEWDDDAGGWGTCIGPGDWIVIVDWDTRILKRGEQFWDDDKPSDSRLSIDLLVVDDMIQRAKSGYAKYGTTIDRKDLSLREWLQHSYEECLDMAKYLKRAIKELDD